MINSWSLAASMSNILCLGSMGVLAIFSRAQLYSFSCYKKDAPSIESLARLSFNLDDASSKISSDSMTMGRSLSSLLSSGSENSSSSKTVSGKLSDTNRLFF